MLPSHPHPPHPLRALNRAWWGKGQRPPTEHEGWAPRHGRLARRAKSVFPQQTAHFGQRLGFLPNSQIQVQLLLALSRRPKLSPENRMRSQVSVGGDPAPRAFSAVGQNGFRIEIAEEAAVCEGPRDGPERRPRPLRPGESLLSPVETTRKREVERKGKLRCPVASGCEESSLSRNRGVSQSLAPGRVGAGWALPGAGVGRGGLISGHPPRWRLPRGVGEGWGPQRSPHHPGVAWRCPG